jgi:hypothetical protein
MTTTAVTPKAGRNITHVLNAYHIGWCIVVADGRISKAAARAAKKAVGAVYLDYAANWAWPYMVEGKQCDVLMEHAVSLEAAAEKGRKMADVLRAHKITSRVYVMTDKQYGMGCPGGTRRLSGLRLEMDERHPQNRTTWVLTAKQSVPVYQTSL